MKLFTRYFRINLLATIVIFVLASLAFYFLLWYVTVMQMDEDLKIEQREIETYVTANNRPPEPVHVKDQNISYEHTDINKSFKKFSTVQSPHSDEPEDFRELVFTLPVNNQWILFRVSKSLEATEHLNRSIVAISLITIVVILLVSLLINRWLLRRLWKPFYSTLSDVEEFRLGGKATPQFVASKIDEFDLLNNTLSRFITNAEREYTTLKEFTENASHELQTPLAIVHSTLDLMMQDEKLTEQQSHSLQAAFTAIKKMSKLNQSLLLLNKIENNQYADVQIFDFRLMVEEKMLDWQELWQGRNLKFESDLESVSVSMNEQLAEIMLNNLFSNAARHTADGGTIHIQLTKDHFEISNTATNGPLDPDKLFQRFSKAGQPTDQHGLGLAIIKQIAEASSKHIQYRFEGNRHIFLIVNY